MIKLSGCCTRIFFQELSLLWRPFEMDLFAGRLNKQVCIYVSWKPDPGATAVDAFCAFPSFPLIHTCLQKITVDKAEGVIIVPMWPNHTFHPRLMFMLIQLQDCYRGRRTCLDCPTHRKRNCFGRKCS